MQLRFIKMKMRFNELYFPAVFLLALICFFTVPNLAVAKGQTFLVEFQDPDFLKILEKYSHVVYDKGRTLLIELDFDYDKLPKEIKQRIRRVDMKEVSNLPAKKSFLKSNQLTQNIVSKVSSARMEAYAASITNTGKRSAAQLDREANSGNKIAMDRVYDILSGFGYKTERYCYKNRKYDDECNIIGRRKGEKEDFKIILIIAHMDSTGHENAGADDNASGTAGLLEMAAILKDYKLDHTLLFVASNGEEIGIKGAYAYVDKLKESGEISKVAWVINMDMISWNNDGIVEIETDKKYINHANWVGGLARLYTNLEPYIATPAWGSDHVPFLRAGIPAYLSIEHWEDHNPCYHRSCDKLEGLNWNYASDIVKLNLAVIAGKANLLPIQ